MANYIHNEILSEAYTHLESDLFDDKEALERLRKLLVAFYTERASFLFGQDVQIEVIFEEGSLKTKIVAWGSAAAIITAAVAGYPSFREGVLQLSHDAVSLAQAANLEVIFRTQTPYCDRIRVEKRKGVFGRVSALINDLDSISHEISSLKLPTSTSKLRDSKEAINRLLTWRENAETLFSKFEGPETEVCVAEGLIAEFRKLPSQLPWKEELSGSGLRSQIAGSDPALAGNVAAEATRYEVTFKSILKDLKNHKDHPKQEE
ncbi:MAG TPA: hypothetical protein VHA15_14915 [Burkholderiales bacterium]|nr:hypothetical protein [Burkholderiales bacterium]